MQNREPPFSSNRSHANPAQASGICDFATIGWFALDRSACILGLNVAGRQLFGWSELATTDRLGQRFDEYLAAPDRMAFSAFLARVFAGDLRPACDANLPGAAGNRKTLRFEASLTADGDTCHLLAVDVTMPTTLAADGLARTTGGALANGQTITACSSASSKDNQRQITIGAGSRLSTAKLSGTCP